MKRLPEPPTLDFFERQLARILRGLRERTAARVLIVTPPLLGEDLSHPVHARISSCSDSSHPHRERRAPHRAQKAAHTTL
jgi:hypothetical protein